MRKAISILICLIVAVSVSGRGNAEPEEEESYRDVAETIQYGGESWIDIRTTAGEVAVRGWDRDEVSVAGEIGEDIQGVDLTQDFEGDTIQVTVVLPDIKNLANLNVDAFLTVRVPHHASVYVSTLGSDVDVEGVIGSVDARTGTGAISVRGPVESVAGKTLSGDISIAGPVGSVEFDVASGSVAVSGAESLVRGSTMNGDIRVEESRISEMVVSTLSGNIFLSGQVQPNARIHAVAQFGGDIEIAVDESIEGLFTLNGGAPQAVDMTEFTPLLPVEWLFGGPDHAAPDRGATRRMPANEGRLALSLQRPRIDGRIDEDDDERIDFSINIPLRFDLGGATREFRVGSGNARIILEVNGLVGLRGDEEQDGSRIILRTAR